MSKKSPSKSAPRNPVAVAMSLRFATTTTSHRDRRVARGGSKNKQREYAKDYE